MAHTFQISDLPISDLFKPQAKAWHQHEDIQKRLEYPLLHATEAQTISGQSPLFSALSLGFNCHVPVAFTPDAIWLTCLVGLNHHIDLNPEGLRRHFVAHEGKKEIRVVAYSPPSTNAWDFLISEFSAQLKENMLPGRHELIVNNFSTTTPIDRLSSEVALMGAMKHYFEYHGIFLCGLTRITIEGTPDDWDNLIDRARALSEFDLAWWTEALVPVLQQFRAACAGEPDLEFWKASYLKHRVGSGGDYNVSGWINALHPYVQGQGKLRRNPYIQWEHTQGEEGLDPNDFLPGLVHAPVKIDDNGVEYDCRFYGGLVGVSLGPDMTVRPESGLAITGQRA